MTKTQELDPKSIEFAFHRAVMSFAHWYKFGGPEPEVNLKPIEDARPSIKKNLVSISKICNLVQPITDNMPEQDCDLLYIMATRMNHRKKPSEEDTYANGAKCLRGLIGRQNERRALEDRLYGQ